MTAVVEAAAAHVAALRICSIPRPACEISIVIPVRNEESSLPATLSRLANQRDFDGLPLDPDRYEVILLINNSDDRSSAVAAEFGRQQPQFALHVIDVEFPENRAHVGTARRTLMDMAADRLGPSGVIATTDADTLVAPDWVAAMLAEFRTGVDAVMGRIVVDPAGFADHHRFALLYHLRDVTYRYLATELESRLAPDPWDPWPRHFQHFGPSIAVTGAAYWRAGGLPALSALEDVAFYDALRTSGARIRHAPSVRVLTSARPVGRTDFGFAVQLRRWSEMGQAGNAHLVDSLPAIIARVTGRPMESGTPELVPIETAIRDLRACLSALRAGRPHEQIQPVGRRARARQMLQAVPIMGETQECFVDLVAG